MFGAERERGFLSHRSHLKNEQTVYLNAFSGFFSNHFEDGSNFSNGKGT